MTNQEWRFAHVFTYPLSPDLIADVTLRGLAFQEDIDRLIEFLTLSKTAFPKKPPAVEAMKEGDKLSPPLAKEEK